MAIGNPVNNRTRITESHNIIAVNWCSIASSHGDEFITVMTPKINCKNINNTNNRKADRIGLLDEDLTLRATAIT